ncbi:MAG TPA: Rne/Rng family ribonuclease [Motilibacterales bacterium]|nr:Rne/Rng family ribonuclease [Motilibacterales bacterium]
MVDDQDQQPADDAQTVGSDAPTQPPRRRRRAASRPAGPPVIGPGEDQVGLFDAPEGGHESSDELASAPSDRVEDEPLAEEDAQDEPAQDEPVADRGADTDPEAAPDHSPVPEQPSEPESPSSASTVRRSRRATRGVTTVAFSAEPAPEATPVVPAAEVPVVALFQPPDETKAVRRRRRPPAELDAAVPELDAEHGDAGRADAEQREAEPLDSSGRDQDLGSAPDAEDTDDDRDDDDAPRRRRRRGGRRRRRGASGTGEDNGSGEGDDEAGQDEADSEPSSADDSLDEDSPSDENESEEAGESSSARRRRRRRRRAGVAEEMEDLSSEDPPNTVVKVREARRPKDEITSVRGSTRIEAKKQRRRDGREAGRRRAPILTEAEFLARREAVNRVMCVREHGDRTQIAVLEDGILVEHYVNRAESSSMVGNVYLGKVQNVLPSMEAAFVDIGRGRNAVLYAGEVNWEAAGLEGQPKRIELALKSGDPVLVQATKDPIGHKGARLTSQISLPGRFLVYVPEGSMTGISRKLPDTERSRLKGILKDVVPDGAGVIVRTAAEGATEEQLTADVTRLAAQWADITKKTKSASPPSLLYGEPDLAIKVVRDIFNEDFTTLLVQGDSTSQTLSDYIGWVAPDLLPKLEKWVEPTDLYAAHRIDEQLAKALDRKVWLPSGGSLVIDRTEAMTVVDVNTGKFTGQGGNLEETVTKNNLEAAEEIVRQLRLRDIGGIIVVDFIDMVLESNRDLVLRRLVECLGRDRTKHQVAEVTSLGLVQMTRKRIGQGLLEVFSTQCEHCGGRGHLVHAEPVGLDHQPVDEGNGRRDRGGRRAAKAPVPAILGGKQTGRTPPPPRFDDQGHIEHDEHAPVGDESSEHGAEASDEHGEPGHEPGASQSHEHGEHGDAHEHEHHDGHGVDTGEPGDGGAHGELLVHEHEHEHGDAGEHDEPTFNAEHDDHHDPHLFQEHSDDHDPVDAV